MRGGHVVVESEESLRHETSYHRTGDRRKWAGRNPLIFRNPRQSPVVPSQGCHRYRCSAVQRCSFGGMEPATMSQSLFPLPPPPSCPPTYFAHHRHPPAGLGPRSLLMINPLEIAAAVSFRPWRSGRIPPAWPLSLDRQKLRTSWNGDAMATGKNHSGKRYVNDTLPVPVIRTKEKLLLLSPLLLLLLLLLLGLEFVISISACYILLAEHGRDKIIVMRLYRRTFVACVSIAELRIEN